MGRTEHLFMSIKPNESAWNRLEKLNVKIIFFILVFLTVVSIVLRLLTPQGRDQASLGASPTPSSSNISNLTKFRGHSVGDIISGTSLTSFGTLLDTKNIGQEKKYLFSSDYISKPNAVIVDSTNRIIAIEENVLGTSNKEYVSEFTSTLGSPDLELYNLAIGESVKTYVYLNHGIAITAHTTDGSVEQKLFFPPTSREAFLTDHVDTLSLTPTDGPE